MRNTAAKPRSVVPIRLSAEERAQIACAARARDLACSTFIRWAATEAANEQLLRAARPKAPKPPPVTEESPSREPIVLEAVQSHHFVDGMCLRCFADAGDNRPCLGEAV